jgi:hypothetical protein
MGLAVTDLTFALLGVPPASITADMRRAYAEVAGFQTSETWLWLPSIK